jgi:predicted small secreted protein
MKFELWKKGIAVVFVSVLSVFSLSACETMKGAGQDIENAGEEIDEAVD